MAKRSMKLVNGPEREVPAFNVLDPHNITPRLQEWISELIEKRSDMTVREEIAAIAAIGRLQLSFVKLREETGGGVATGTEVKRFAEAFASNASRKRKGLARSSSAAVAALEYDDDTELEY